MTGPQGIARNGSLLPWGFCSVSSVVELGCYMPTVGGSSPSRSTGVGRCNGLASVTQLGFNGPVHRSP